MLMMVVLNKSSTMIQITLIHHFASHICTTVYICKMYDWVDIAILRQSLSELRNTFVFQRSLPAMFSPVNHIINIYIPAVIYGRFICNPRAVVWWNETKYKNDMMKPCFVHLYMPLHKFCYAHLNRRKTSKPLNWTSPMNYYKKVKVKCVQMYVSIYVPKYN